MASKFYVDIDALNEYSNFLKKAVNELNINLDVLNRANRNLIVLHQDEVSRKVTSSIKNLNIIFKRFSVEVEKMSKKVNDDYELYVKYLKSFK